MGMKILLFTDVQIHVIIIMILEIVIGLGNKQNVLGVQELLEEKVINIQEKMKEPGKYKKIKCK